MITFISLIVKLLMRC